MTALGARFNANWLGSGAKWFGVNLLYYIGGMAISAALFFAVVTALYLFRPASQQPAPAVDLLPAPIPPKTAPAISQPPKNSNNPSEPAAIPIAKINPDDAKALKGRTIYAASGSALWYVDEVELDASGRLISLQVISFGSRRKTKLPAESVDLDKRRVEDDNSSVNHGITAVAPGVLIYNGSPIGFDPIKGPDREHAPIESSPGAN